MVKCDVIFKSCSINKSSANLPFFFSPENKEEKAYKSGAGSTKLERSINFTAQISASTINE